MLTTIMYMLIALMTSSLFTFLIWKWQKANNYPENAPLTTGELLFGCVFGGLGCCGYNKYSK